ncbi:MAG: caspase family protein [Smithella sp.]
MEKRIALVIGNSSYSSGPLKNPVNDATDMASALQKFGFKVYLKKNANLETMEEAIENFGNQLKKGGVGLFYYAGHGVQVNGANYLIPTGVKINKESDVRYKAVDAGRILDEMANANNGLNIVILDACRDNPFAKSFRSASRGLAIVTNAPTGTFISYSTAAGQVARDGSGRNSPYTTALLKFMQEPGIPISKVFMKVRQKLRKDTGQVPWELSSLEGDFYFVHGSGNDTEKSKVIPVIENEPKFSSVDFEDEQSKIRAEKEKLRQERELLELRKALEEEKRKLEDAKQKQASIPRFDSAKGTNFIDFIKAKVTEVKFFEGPYNAPEKANRSYRTSFSRTGTRFVNWELNLEFPLPGARKDFDIEHIWINPYGKEIFRGSWKSYVMGDWTSSWHSHSYGWREASLSGWVIGTYRVDLYVHGVKIASESFSIY